MGQSYRDLIAWQKAITLVTDVYKVTKQFPAEELYGLTSQLRRASVSIASDIAEGQARFSSREFHHFLTQARGSLAEIETQLLIARNLGYLRDEDSRSLNSRTSELGRILNRLMASIRCAS
jgi:four helix bundle protein